MHKSECINQDIHHHDLVLILYYEKLTEFMGVMIFFLIFFYPRINLIVVQ